MPRKYISTMIISTTIRLPMTFCLKALCLTTFCLTTFCLPLLASLPAQAADGSTFTVESGGIRISVTQPWSLSTRGVFDQPDYVSSLTLYDDEEGVIAGEGRISVFPYQDDPYPEREELMQMDAEALAALVDYYHEYYLKFALEDDADLPVVEEINGFTGVVVRQKKGAEDATEKDFSVRYYFSFKDKFVYLAADVTGDDAAGELFNRIFASFEPQTSVPADITAVHSDGLSLSCPRSWPVAVGGISNVSTWAVLTKEDDDEDAIVNVTVFPPAAAGSAPTDMEERLRAAYSILQTNSPTKRITPLGARETTVGDFPATLTSVQVAVESESEKPMFVELRDIAAGDSIVAMVTSYADEPSEETEKELEAVYASFTWAP